MPPDFNLVEIIIAAAGVVGSWAVLRATVSDLKRDVTTLKDLVLLVNTLQANQRTTETELERVRAGGHDTRNRMQDLSERVARLEAHQGESP